MSEHDTIIAFLNELRNSNKIILDMFLLGSCINLYCMLKVLYPHAECYYGQVPGHVITKVSDRFYDITGEIIDVKEYELIHNIWRDIYKTDADIKQGEMYNRQTQYERC